MPIHEKIPEIEKDVDHEGLQTILNYLDANGIDVDCKIPAQLGKSYRVFHDSEKKERGAHDVVSTFRLPSMREPVRSKLRLVSISYHPLRVAF